VVPALVLKGGSELRRADAPKPGTGNPHPEKGFPSFRLVALTRLASGGPGRRNRSSSHEGFPWVENRSKAANYVKLPSALDGFPAKAYNISING
jgi:hypothetical protein